MYGLSLVLGSDAGMYVLLHKSHFMADIVFPFSLLARVCNYIILTYVHKVRMLIL